MICILFFSRTVLCFKRPRETDNKSDKRKEALNMKKLSKLVKEFYESFSHREG